MFKPSTIGVCYLFTFLVGCTGSQVISFINDDMDLRDYNTYRLVRINPDDVGHSTDGLVFYTQLEKAIVENMDQRLFKEARDPDLIVRYEIAASQRTEISNRSSNLYNPYYYYSPSQTVTRNISEGVLIIEFRDRKQQTLVWQGTLDLVYNAKKDRTEIAELVDQIFTTYPYIAGSYEQINVQQKR